MAFRARSVGSCTYNFVHFDRLEIRTRWDINSIVLPCFPCAQTNMWCILINQTLNVNVEQKNMPTTDACVRVFHTTIFGELKQRIAYWHVQIRREYFFWIIFFFRQSDWIRCSCKRTRKKSNAIRRSYSIHIKLIESDIRPMVHGCKSMPCESIRIIRHWAIVIHGNSSTKYSYAVKYSGRKSKRDEIDRRASQQYFTTKQSNREDRLRF